MTKFFLRFVVAWWRSIYAISYSHTHSPLYNTSYGFFFSFSIIKCSYDYDMINSHICVAFFHTFILILTIYLRYDVHHYLSLSLSPPPHTHIYLLCVISVHPLFLLSEFLLIVCEWVVEYDRLYTYFCCRIT